MTDPWESGLLDRGKHADRKLVAEPRFAEIAGVPQSVLWTRPSEVCTAREINALEGLAYADDVGMAYSGPWPALTRRMQLLTGKLMRNRQDARLRLVSAMEDDEDCSSCDVLLVPDLADIKVAPRHLQAAVSTLKHRAARGLLSIVALPPDPEDVKSRFGESFFDIVMETYTVLVQE